MTRPAWPSDEVVLGSARLVLRRGPEHRGLLATSYGARLGDDDVELLLVLRSEATDAAFARVPLDAATRLPRVVAPFLQGLVTASQGVSGYREHADRPTHRALVFRAARGTSLAPLVAAARRGEAWRVGTTCTLVSALADAASEPRFDPPRAGLDADGPWMLHPLLDRAFHALRAQGQEGALWLGYAAPEGLRGGDAPHGGAFGLGVLAFELLTGRALFARRSALDTLRALARETPPPITKLAPHVPLDVASCVQALLDRDPLCRPSATRIRAVLAPFRDEQVDWTAFGTSDPSPFLRRL